jgi:hypothetical protein
MVSRAPREWGLEKTHTLTGVTLSFRRDPVRVKRFSTLLTVRLSRDFTVRVNEGFIRFCTILFRVCEQVWKFSG